MFKVNQPSEPNRENIKLPSIRSTISRGGFARKSPAQQFQTIDQQQDSRLSQNSLNSYARTPMSRRKDDNTSGPRLNSKASVGELYGRKRQDSSLTNSTAPFESNLFAGKKHSASAKKIFETLEKNTRKRLSIQDFDRDLNGSPKLKTTKNTANTRLSLPDRLRLPALGLNSQPK